MKCQYFGCTQEATVRIPSVNMIVCDEHYALNVVRFGCEFKFEVLNKEADHDTPLLRGRFGR